MCRPAGAFLIFSHDSHSFRCGLRFVVPTALFGNTVLVHYPTAARIDEKPVLGRLPVGVA